MPSEGDETVLQADLVRDEQTQTRLLLERCRAGDKGAFDELIRLYERRVYNFAYRLCSDYDEACDVAADTFVRIYNSLSSFRGDASFVTWLFRVVTNIYLDHRKRARSRPAQSLDEIIELEETTVQRQIEDTREAPHQRAESSERTELLQHAIAGLPEYQRIMIVMFHSEGRSYEEIADVLNLPIGTVKSRLNRARLSLRDKLALFPEHFQP